MFGYLFICVYQHLARVQTGPLSCHAGLVGLGRLIIEPSEDVDSGYISEAVSTFFFKS